MQTKSTTEAMAVLKATRKRLIEQGRKTAIELIKKNGSTNSLEVFTTMKKRGLIDGSVRNFWLGAVFHNNPAIRPTHKTVSYHDSARNIHERTIQCWELAEGG